ncbi:MAG TPA: chromate resistance protein ChrB domain-containing protein [Blastocatellia bacterium]|nr:chromate resistance protein ChrB domain-containing protein [Blastocatellia bacterium]
MKHSGSKRKWILLIHQLPAKPTNLRVRTWRKLQKLGAVSIKNSVYILPFNEKTNEDFQWLKQEVESTGGEAAVFHADAVEGATDQEIVAVFHKQRNEEYATIAAELEGITGSIREQKKGGHLSASRISNYEAEIDKLHKELERIITIDFFDASGRAAAAAAYERCLRAFRTSQNPRGRLVGASKSAALNLNAYQGKRWVTRRNIFIDRIAAIWLIKRFIDKRPRFFFVSEGESVEGAISFDMYGAVFTHRGEDCSFETMIKEFSFSEDEGLRQIAEIVHDMDLKDNKFNRSEATGLNAVIRGLADLLKDDRKLMQQCTPIFDGLYELLRGDDKKIKMEGSKKQVRGSTSKRRKQIRKK